MYPSVGDHLSTYVLCIAAGVSVGVAVAIHRLRAIGLDPWRGVQVELVLAVAGLLGAKGYAIVERGYVLPLADELTGSLRYPGALFAVAAVLVLFPRSLLRDLSLPALSDAIAPTAALAAAIARLGCFAHGCCFGIQTALPWGMQFPAQSPAWHAHVAARSIVSAAPHSLPVHPLQLYFALSSAALALTVVWYAPRARYIGQAAVVFVALDGVLKALLETLRAEPQRNLQLAALAATLLAASTLWLNRRARREATA